MIDVVTAAAAAAAVNIAQRLVGMEGVTSGGSTDTVDLVVVVGGGGAGVGAGGGGMNTSRCELAAFLFAPFCTPVLEPHLNSGLA